MTLVSSGLHRHLKSSIACSLARYVEYLHGIPLKHNLGTPPNGYNEQGAHSLTILRKRLKFTH